MDHIKSLFTCRPTQAPEPPTLDELCHNLNIQAMSQRLPDSSPELRANSARGPVRLKKGTARMTNLNARDAHRAHAYALVRDSFQKSVELHLQSVERKNRELKGAALWDVWVTAQHATRRGTFITLEDVLKTRARFEKVRLIERIPKKVESTRPNLCALYKQLAPRPQGPKGEDSELRADSDSDQIRVKTRTALVTRVPTRLAHQARAHALVRAAFLRQLELYETTISPDAWPSQKVKLAAAWDTEIGVRPITRRKVNSLTMKLGGIVAPDSWRPPTPKVDPGWEASNRRVIWHIPDSD